MFQMGTEEPGEEPVQTGVLLLPSAECGASAALLQDRVSVRPGLLYLHTLLLMFLLFL